MRMWWCRCRGSYQRLLRCWSLTRTLASWQCQAELQEARMWCQAGTG